MGSRINLGDLKSQIAKRVGPDRAQQYFGYLNRLLSQKLSKPEFNKLCLLTLGHENLHLHNQLVRSVFKNACQAGTPPLSIKNVPKWSPQLSDDGPKAAQLPATWSNGDILPQSPRRSRAGVVRWIKDRPSPIGQNGRAEVITTSHQHLAPPDEVIRENGDLGLYDLKRPVHLLERRPPEQLSKRARREEHLSMVLVESADVEKEREDSERRNDVSSSKVPVQAPLGIPCCPPSIGGARRNLAPAAATSLSSCGSCSEIGELFRTDDLRRQMERIAEGQGLGGVALECANLLNNGLDAYLKRLIWSCAELVGTSSGRSQMKQQVYKHQAPGKPINGVWQGNHTHLQSGGPSLDGLYELKNRRSISLQDFRIAMELNPQQLGDDWPLLLEKICHHSFEE